MWDGSWGGHAFVGAEVTGELCCPFSSVVNLKLLLKIKIFLQYSKFCWSWIYFFMVNLINLNFLNPIGLTGLHKLVSFQDYKVTRLCVQLN